MRAGPACSRRGESTAGLGELFSLVSEWRLQTLAMGSAASAQRRSIKRVLEDLDRQDAEATLAATQDSPALLNLGHGTIRHRQHDQLGDPGVRSGYFYHPKHDDFSAGASVRFMPLAFSLCGVANLCQLVECTCH